MSGTGFYELDLYKTLADFDEGQSTFVEGRVPTEFSAQKKAVVFVTGRPYDKDWVEGDTYVAARCYRIEPTKDGFERVALWTIFGKREKP